MLKHKKNKFQAFYSHAFSLKQNSEFFRFNEMCSFQNEDFLVDGTQPILLHKSVILCSLKLFLNAWLI